VVYARYRIVEVLRGAHALRSETNHALGASTTLRRGIARPGFEQTFCFQAIDGRVERPDGAFWFSGRFDFFSNRCAIGVLSEAGRGGNHFALGEFEREAIAQVERSGAVPPTRLTSR
jgi:hypothetical protein